jgi:Domain of unknown function (DUF4157)
VSRPASATTKTAKRAARRPAQPAQAEAAAAFIGPRPFLPSVAPTRGRRGPAALEREADRTADAVLAGAVGLARTLTTTRPATRHVPGSAGHPLRPHDRDRLERALGADLSRVRIHDDAAAHWAAELEGAAAFVAGPDVYLGPDACHPDTDEGFRLLAHELAHTLQQTGRASVDGRRRVTDARGPGEIQAAPDRFLDRFIGSTPHQVFTIVAGDHGGPDDPSPIASYLRVVAARLNSEVDPVTDAWQELVTDAEAGTHGATTPAEQSFLLDLMKSAEEWDAAAALLDAAPQPLATRWASDRFAEWLFLAGGRPKDWASGIVETTPTLKRYRDLVYGAFRIFLVRPDLKAYSVGDDTRLEMYLPPDWVTGVLAVNERVALAAQFLTDLERNRFQLCREIDLRSGSALVSDDERDRDFARNPVYRGWRRAGELHGPLERWAATAKGAGEPIAQRGVAWFEDRRQRAMTFWQTALEEFGNQLTARLSTGRTDLPEERRAEMRRALKANPVAVAAARRVSAAAVVCLAPAQAELPSPTAYAERLAVFRKELDAQLDALFADLSQFKLDEATGARAVLVPWLALRLERLRQQTFAYVAKKDVSGFDDTRHGHRLDLSTELRRLAYELDDSALEEAAEAVQHNEAGQGSRLVLIGDWTRPASSDLDKLKEDFDRGIKLSNTILLDPRGVAEFYREAYMRRLGDAIDMLLDPTLKDAVRDRLVLQESVRAANQAPTAARWTVEDMDWAPRTGETRTVAELIEGHPKSVAQLPAVTLEEVVVYPGQEQPGSLEATPHLDGVFAWELPQFDALVMESVTALSAIPEVLELVGPVGTDPVAWLVRFDELMGTDKGPSQERVRIRIWNHLHARAEVQRTRLGVDAFPPGLLRQATNHDRAVVAARVDQLLTTYDATIGTWVEPLEALDLITEFHRYAQPAADNLSQTTALIVDVAGALRKAFVREAFWGSVVLEEERYDLVTGYYGFLVIAQLWLKDPARRALLTKSFLRLTDVELAAREADLAAVREAFENVQRRIQSGRGFESTSDGALRSLNYPFLVTTEHQFGTSGSASFQLMRVMKRFIFHPKYGEAGQLVQGVDAQQRPAEVIDATTKKLLPPTTELFEMRVNDRPMIVYARDVELLDDIWRAVEEKAFQLSMDNLLQAMSDIATLAVDLVELVPGAGQAVMVGRIVLSVATFLASADFEDIKAIVTGELVEQVTGLIAGLEAMLDPDEIWMFLLFGSDNALLHKLANTGGGAKKPRPVTRKPGRLGRLLRALLSLGALIARQVEMMRERIQPPLRSAQSFVVTHPIVGMVVNLAAAALAMGPAIAEGVTWLGEFANDPAKVFAQKVEGLVSVIEHFELPTEIIPNAVLVAAILGLLLDRFGAKGKIIRRILDATGAMGEISQMVSDALPEAAKPNRIWVETLKPLVDKVLNDLRREFIDGIYGALELIGVTTAHKPDHKPITAKGVPGPDHEEDAAEPALAPGFPAPLSLDHMISARGGDVLPPGPGTPLPPHTRAPAEVGLGRSFEHVRLHRATLGEGVDALTRGSHVVMRPGLSLDAGRGAHVLRHELRHVADNTAAQTRPRPTRGRPGTAVRFDPAAEARAEHTAAGGGADGARRTPDDAAAPALSDTVLSRVLSKLADYQDLREYQEDIHSGITTLPSLTAEQTTDMTKLQQKLVAVLRSKTLSISGVPAKSPSHTDIHDLVRQHAANAAERIRTFGHEHPESIDRLGRRALKEDTSGPKKKKKKGDAVQERKLVLVPSQLSALLEGYLLIRTGLLVAVKFPDEQALFETALRGTAALDLEVNGVFLGAAIKTSPLWKPILDDQLKVGATLEGADVGGVRNKFTIKDAQDQERIFQALVSKLRALGPQFRALELLTYEFVKGVIEEAVDENLTVGTDLDPLTLPSPTAYLNPTVGSLGVNEIGLRISTHKRLTATHARDRDSHHTTQYLFSEYLTHRATPKPFGTGEPGLDVVGGVPDTLYRADGGARIRLGDLHGPSSSRGDPMPAILTSRPTHQNAGLHVALSRPMLPDDSAKGSNQASTVHSWFRAKAKQGPDPAALAPAGSTPPTVASMPEPAKARNRELVAGVEHVYTLMRTHMMHRLQDALHKHEKPYYESVAARRPGTLDAQGVLKPEWQLDIGKLDHVFTLAEKNNDDVMKSYGVHT